ncbi:MAG TPA: SPFH domain-containing protein [Acidimicrobiales bacterium]|nr:SPFH domain-containing protein [Acidimicrobiales bacterium]
MFGWHVPTPDEAMLISGRRTKGDDPPFRIVTGHGSFVMPVLSRASFLTLAMQESEVAEECVTKQGIALLCRAVIAFKVGDDHESIANAARRFLDDQDRMSVLTGRIFAGHLRSIIGSMTVEEIIRERQRLAEEVLDASKPEMEKIGLVVDSLQIQSIDDRGSGYIAALAAPHQAAVQRDAQIARAQAEQAAAQAQQESLRNQAEYERQTSVTQAGYKAEVDRAQSQAAAAGPLATAEAQKAVLEAQAELAIRNGELKEKELVASVQKPAEAEAYRIRTLAQAESDRTRLQAEATASAQGIALQRMLVERMPDIIAAAASQLANANVTVLNGADGLGQLVAGLAGQAGQLMRLVQDGLGVNGGGAAAGALGAANGSAGAGGSGGGGGGGGAGGAGGSGGSAGAAGSGGAAEPGE